MNFLLSENKASQIQRLTTIPALNWGMSEALYPHLYTTNKGEKKTSDYSELNRC